MRLSLLDRSRTRVGEPESAALESSIERAVRAEAFGYDRFWVAEHHGVPGIASGSPALLLAAIGARTTTIRLGSGGVMLPHHQPFVVAEQFLMLDALYPGRVDLGLGRSRGFTDPVRRALRTDDSDTFAADLGELQGYLHGTGAVTAHPAGRRPVPLFVLATGRGLEVAADLGLPVVVGGPILADPDAARAALDGYRRRFRPGARSAAPMIVLSLDLYVADTEDDARELALPEAWAMARARQTGEFHRSNRSRTSDGRPGATRCADGSTTHWTGPGWRRRRPPVRARSSCSSGPAPTSCSSRRPPSIARPSPSPTGPWRTRWEGVRDAHTECHVLRLAAIAPA